MTLPFRTIATGPLRAVVVGAGSMGRAWLTAVDANPDVVLAGVVDIEVDVASESVAATGVQGAVVGADLSEVVARSNANVVLDITTPDAHLAVTLEALALGLPVLGEKPLASTVEEGLILVAAARAAGQLFMVSQSRRYNGHLRAFRDSLGQLGEIGIVSSEFFKAAHFGGFREAMANPLLVDMAIHQFDMARYLLAASPVAVYCEEYNPSWSWFSGAAAATAVFEMESGCRYVYSGSWCSPGNETSWNACWRISGAAGTALWDGDTAPTVSPGLVAAPDRDDDDGVSGALAEFVHALRTGTEPMGVAHDNVMSLAMVEAAVLSAATHQRVLLADLLQDAFVAAAATTDPVTRARLLGWSSPTDLLGYAIPASPVAG